MQGKLHVGTKIFQNVHVVNVLCPRVAHENTSKRKFANSKCHRRISMEHLETFLSCFKQEYNSPCPLHIISSHRNVLISTFYGHFWCQLQVRGDFRLAPQNSRDFTGPLFHDEARRLLIKCASTFTGKTPRTQAFACREFVTIERQF